MQSTNDQIRKPAALKVIFILNALMMVLPFVFYLVFTLNNIKVGDLDPMWMIYTGLAYIISFVPLTYFLSHRNINGARVVFLVNLLIAIPASAYIGVIIAITSLALSFFNSNVKTYFMI